MNAHWIIKGPLHVIPITANSDGMKRANWFLDIIGIIDAGWILFVGLGL